MSTTSEAGGRYGLLPLFLIAVVLVWAAPLFWRQVETPEGALARAQENRDLYEYVYPALSYGFGRLGQGELPLWNPHQLCGVPFLADSRVGLFDPLRLPFLFLPTASARAVHAFLCLFLMALFSVLFLRSLNASHVAALVGAVAYAFSGAAAAGMSRPGVASVLVWTPVLFWAIHEYGRRYRFAFAVLLGAAGAATVLSGAWAAAAVALCSAGLYAALVCGYATGGVRPGFMRRVAGLCVAVALAVSLSAIQTVPTLVWLYEGAGPASLLWGSDVPGQTAANLAEAVQQAFLSQPGLVPRLGYVGIPTLLLLCAGVFHRKARREALFFIVCGAGPLAGAVMAGDILPWAFPPEVMYFPATFCAAMLAGLGCDRLLTPRLDHRSPSIWLPALVVIGLAGLVLYLSDAPVRGRVVMFVLVLLPFLLVRARWLAPLSGLAVALVLFSDLNTAANNAYRHPYQDAPQCYEEYQTAVTAARERVLGERIGVSAAPMDYGLPENIGMLTGLDTVGGTGLLATRAQQVWWEKLEGEPGGTVHGVTLDAAAPELLNAMALRAVLATPGGDLSAIDGETEGQRFEVMDQAGEVRILTNEQGFPLAYWAPSWQTVDSTEEAVEILAGPGFDSVRECVVEGDGVPSPGPAGPSDGEEAVCSVERVSPEQVVVRVDAPEKGMVVLADTFACGWEATLNGKPCVVRKVNGIFRGIYLPRGGVHEIVFLYRPKSMLAGLALALAGLGSAVLAGLGGLLRRK